MSPSLRKLALAAHITSSVGWLGAVVAFLPLAIIGVSSRDVLAVRASFLGMAWLVSYAIVPLAFASLATGLVSALGSPWGLFRYRWVVAKLLLTVLCIAVLLVQIGPIEDLATRAREPADPVFGNHEAHRPLVHAAGGLAVLLVTLALGVYKPGGLTRYGRRHDTEPEVVGGSKTR